MSYRDQILPEPEPRTNGYNPCTTRFEILCKVSILVEILNCLLHNADVIYISGALRLPLLKE